MRKNCSFDTIGPCEECEGNGKLKWRFLSFEWQTRCPCCDGKGQASISETWSYDQRESAFWFRVLHWPFK